MKDLYLKIVNLFRENVPFGDIVRKLNCAPEAIRNALKWELDQAPEFTDDEEVRLAIEAKQNSVGHLKQRLQEIRKGVKEVTRKTAPAKEGKRSVLKERIVSVKSSPTLEAALWKLIREYERDIDGLKGIERVVLRESSEPKKKSRIIWNLGIVGKND